MIRLASNITSAPEMIPAWPPFGNLNIPLPSPSSGALWREELCPTCPRSITSNFERDYFAPPRISHAGTPRFRRCFSGPISQSLLRRFPRKFPSLELDRDLFTRCLCLYAASRPDPAGRRHRQALPDPPRLL